MQWKRRALCGGAGIVPGRLPSCQHLTALCKDPEPVQRSQRSWALHIRAVKGRDWYPPPAPYWDCSGPALVSQPWQYWHHNRLSRRWGRCVVECLAAESWASSHMLVLEGTILNRACNFWKMFIFYMFIFKETWNLLNILMAYPRS